MILAIPSETVKNCGQNLRDIIISPYKTPKNFEYAFVGLYDLKDI
jgi:hypothetical protein